jgi:hypothetical protein
MYAPHVELYTLYNMDLRHHKMTSYDWYYEYESKMGRTEFKNYINKVWIALEKLKVGQHIDIKKHVVSENYDLFIKTCSLFIHETKSYHYEFNNEYTKIIHRYDAREMAEEFELRKRKREQNAIRANGGQAGSDGTRTETIPAPSAIIS